MEFESLLEVSEELNLGSINLTHGDYPCHCVAQTVWYPEQSKFCLLCNIEEIRAIGLPEHQQKLTFFVLNSILALRWIEETVIKYRESKAPPVEATTAIEIE